MRIGRFVPAALATVIATAGVAGAVTIASASASGAHAAATYTLSVKSTSLGKILVNSKGDTVYIFAKDKKGSNKTACNTACLAVWPLVTVSGKPTGGPGVNAKDIGTFKVGSQTEVTYNGYPLYTYVVDKSPGQTTGQAVNNSGGLWYVISSTGTPITKK